MRDSQAHRIAGVIREYDLQGWHRSGTEVDHASARWLAERVGECGLEPELERFDFQRVDPELAYVEVGGRKTEGVPLFDGGFTGPEGVAGPLGPLGSGSAIGVAEAGPELVREYMEARRAGDHGAIVAVTPTGAGVALMNAVHFFDPFGPPVLQVGSEELERLVGEARQGSEAKVVVTAARRPAKSYNVTARMEGRDGGLAPVVVMTPAVGGGTARGSAAAASPAGWR